MPALHSLDIDDASGMTQMMGRRFRIAVVYIAEAHAEDKWPIGGLYRVPSHKNVAEREAAARKMASVLGWNGPMLMDSMDDGMLNTYGAWPVGLYVFVPSPSGPVLSWQALPNRARVDIVDALQEAAMRGTQQE